MNVKEWVALQHTPEILQYIHIMGAFFKYCSKLKHENYLIFLHHNYFHSEDDELLADKDAVEAFLRRNFLVNYYTNKAPFGLYAHHSWFYEGTLNKTEARREGYTK